MCGLTLGDLDGIANVLHSPSSLAYLLNLMIAFCRRSDMSLLIDIDIELFSIPAFR